MGNPVAAEHETQTVTPGGCAAIISLKQPLAPLPRQQGILRGVHGHTGLTQKNATGTSCIHHHGYEAIVDIPSQALNPDFCLVGIEVQQPHAMTRQKLHTGLEGLVPEPGAKGGEVENDTEGIPRPPLLGECSRAEELPTPPLG